MSRIVRTFQPRFARLVESGTKRQTIRKTPKRMPKVGDIFVAREWTGAPYRSKQRKLLEAPIREVSEVEIFTKRVKVNGRLILVSSHQEFAEADGFSSIYEMRDWLRENHSLPFKGIIIKFT
jgi:hypothetical protein